MSKIIYLPVEHPGGIKDVRNNSLYDHYITNWLDRNNREYIRIYPDIEHLTSLKAGSFLDAEFTIRFKSAQLEEVARLYREDVIQSGDIIWSADLWHPGIEGIAYMNYFAKKDVKIRGMLHAGSFTDTDFVRDLERWAKNFEDIIFDISDKIYVGSEFIKNDVIKKRIVDPNKLVVTGFPINEANLGKFYDGNKEDIVLFSARNVDEKQPWLFEELTKRLKSKPEYKNVQFINTLEHNFTKDEYYGLLAKSKIMVSYALQENFGVSIQEAADKMVVPVVPNRLVYPEFFGKEHLYDTFEESVSMVEHILDNWNMDNGYWHIERKGVSCNSNEKIMEMWFNE